MIVATVWLRLDVPKIVSGHRSVSIRSVHDNILDPGILILRLIPDVATPPVRQAAILLVNAVRWHAVYVGTDRQSSRHTVAIAWIIPPEVIIIVVAGMTSVGPIMIAAVAWPVVVTATARPVVITATARPVVITATAKPTRKAVIDLSSTAKTSTGPVIITAP